MTARAGKAARPAAGAPAQGPAPRPSGAAPAAAAPAGSGWRIGPPAEASRIHSRLGVGELQRDGSLVLHPLEAAWMAASERAPFAAPDFARIVAAAGAGTLPYQVYQDLRDRGLSVRAGPLLAVMPRGKGAAGGPPSYVVRPCAERDGVDVASLRAAAAGGEVLAVADDDGDVTYYRASVAQPGGDVPPTRLAQAAGELVGDRVWVAGAVGRAWHEAEAFGHTLGTGLLLPIVEAEHLRRRGVLRVPRAQELALRQSVTQGAGPAGPALAGALPPAVMAAYEALRAAGVVAKSGYKFGAHLRGYRGRPGQDHAAWLVHCPPSAAPSVPGPGEVRPTGGVTAAPGAAPAASAWSDVARGVRVAHGVRKAFLVWTGDGFVELTWFKP